MFLVLFLLLSLHPSSAAYSELILMVNCYLYISCLSSLCCSAISSNSRTSPSKILIGTPRYKVLEELCSFRTSSTICISNTIRHRLLILQLVLFSMTICRRKATADVISIAVCRRRAPLLMLENSDSSTLPYCKSFDVYLAESMVDIGLSKLVVHFTQNSLNATIV